MKVIVIASRKGGTGKTATAHALSAGLMRRGNKVLMIDLDSQGNLTFSTGAENSPYTLLDALTGKVPAEQILQHTDQGDLLPASPNLAAADTVLIHTGKEYALRDLLEPIKGRYDYAVIDTPAQLGVTTIAALTAADDVIIPVQADIFSLAGIDLLIDAIGAVKKYTNPALNVRGVLITRYNGRSNISKDMREMLDQMARRLDTKLFNSAIRECVAVKEAAALQRDIFSYAPRSNAAKDYTAFIDELMS